jgi:glycerol-3-phosphate dehydrogenase
MKSDGVFESDVLIIGGGFTGISIARELSKYKARTVVVERGGELAAGASKATLGQIYTGLNMVGSMLLKSIMLPAGTPLTPERLHDPAMFLTQWSDQGFHDWSQILDDLDVGYRFTPLLIVARSKEQIEDLKNYIVLGKAMGGIFSDFTELGKDEILELEPNVSKDILTGLYAKDHVIDIFPPEVLIAMGENAAQNGIRILLNAEVSEILRKNDYHLVKTSRGTIKSGFIVNAAGGWADKVADMVGDRDWSLQYNKTQIIVLDNRLKGLLNGTVRYPNKPGQIQLVQARDNNVVVECGTYDPTNSPKDTGTIRENVHKGMAIAKTLVPVLSEDDIISTFTGVRVFNTRQPGDHIVEFSPTDPKFLNVLIRLPGIIGAPPMARHVVSMLGDAGLELVRNAEFTPYRKAIPKFRELGNVERNELIAQDPRYGHVVCRCETVTEGEIVEAIARGAVTLDGIKFRTRANMGRCQGNFCGPRIAAILARELAQPLDSITKKGQSSNYVF